MDWKQLLKDLDLAGWTQKRIAAHCGAAQSTVSDLSRGAIKEPGFGLGTKLLALREDVLKVEQEAAPFSQGRVGTEGAPSIPTAAVAPADPSGQEPVHAS